MSKSTIIKKETVIAVSGSSSTLFYKLLNDTESTVNKVNKKSTSYYAKQQFVAKPVSNVKGQEYDFIIENKIIEVSKSFRIIN